MLRPRLAAALAVLAVAALPLVAAPSATAAPAHDPVITVHGFAGYSSQFNPIKDSLVKAGWSKSNIFDFGYNSANSNVQTANLLKTYVEKIKKQTGAAKVDLLVHSMGAINSRYYLKSLGGSSSVDAWISMGGANQGTDNVALSLCAPFLAACADLKPGSPILTGLNTGDPTPGTTRYFSHYSTCDGTVTPYTNILLDTATNIPVEPCVSHNNYFSVASVQDQIKVELG